MRKLKYLCYYDTPDNIKDNRRYTLSAANVVTYIAEVIADYNVRNIEIVSIAGSNNRNGCKGGRRKIEKGISLRSFSSLGYGGRVRNKIDFWLMQIQTFFYLALHLSKDDDLLVYHSIYYMKMVSILKKIRKFNLILQVEEIYADVVGDNSLRKKELSFFKLADSYIFPTVLLDKEINQTGKPAVFIHGTYKVEPMRKCNFQREEIHDDLEKEIHCVYAGTLDPQKGGAAAAAAAAEFLPSNYSIHILGFGTPNEIESMKDTVAKIANKKRAKVSYDGVLSGEEYIRFIQSCDIGLSTQNPNADFNNTSFPSKILSYLSNGLRVVTVDIPAIRTSAVGDILFYYDEQSAENIAKTILSIDLTKKYDSRHLIEQIATDFSNNLLKLL